MKTTKDGTGKGKYGRWLAELFRADGDVISINQELVTKGLAAPASY
jgi:endonuclease YncB( thermonuclease family)